MEQSSSFFLLREKVKRFLILKAQLFKEEECSLQSNLLIFYVTMMHNLCKFREAYGVGGLMLLFKEGCYHSALSHVLHGPGSEHV